MARRRKKGKKEDRKKRKSRTEEARRALIEKGAKKNHSDSFGSSEFRPLLNRQNRSLFIPSLTGKVHYMKSSGLTENLFDKWRICSKVKFLSPRNIFPPIDSCTPRSLDKSAQLIPCFRRRYFNIDFGFPLGHLTIFCSYCSMNVLIASR